MFKDVVRNIRLSQTWVEDQVKFIKSEYEYSKDSEAFQALVYGLLFETDYDGIPQSEIIEGSGEKQIDIIRIEENEDFEQATIHIVQTKYHKGFSSNAISLINNGLEWIFITPEKDYKKLKNNRFVFNIEEIRKLRNKYGHDGLKINVYFATNGDTKILLDENASQEYIEEKRKFLPKWTNQFNEFNYYEIGATELTELIETSNRSKRKVNTDIEIVYDTNVSSLIRYTSKDSRAIICTIRGKELARLASLEPRDAIFDLNVRPYYGSRGQVNSQIYATCQDEKQSQYFWFLNNGITMICDTLDFIPDPDKAKIRVTNAQIINGCQTSVSIREASEKGRLRDDVTVLLRIYATSNSDLAKVVTLTTNNQNKITDRDLRANDSVQQLIQNDMKDRFSYLYERKNKQYRNIGKEERKKIVPNDRAGQAYLAVVKRKPSQSRGYLAKIWSTYYKDIFENSVVEDLLLSYLIYSYFLNKSKGVKEISSSNTSSILLVYGAFHLARIVGHYLTNDNWGSKYRSQNQRHIVNLKNNGLESLDQYYPKAIEVLSQIWDNELDVDKKINPPLYFKAGKVEKSIEKALGYEDNLAE
jgi:hypothetical protein